VEARLSPGDLALDGAPQLAFSIEDGGVLDYAAVPTLRFALRVESTTPVRSVALNVQVRIAATRRAYTEDEREGLVELFGGSGDWGRNLRSLHWTNVAVQVGPFSDTALVEMPITCTYDLEVTATRYFHGLAGGEVPLEFLFGGTVFFTDGDGRLQVRPIAWDREADFRLPVSAWRQMMERHFPGYAWLRLEPDAFERLYAYRRENTLLTWEQTIDALLNQEG
jgi:Family of unknown function (DUF6084)